MRGISSKCLFQHLSERPNTSRVVFVMMWQAWGLNCASTCFLCICVVARNCTLGFGHIDTLVSCARNAGGAFSSSARVSSSLMVCVRLLDGTDVMTPEEYSLWWDELCEQEDGDCFFNTLRRHLAKRFPISHWYPIFLLFFVLLFKINEQQQFTWRCPSSHTK